MPFDYSFLYSGKQCTPFHKPSPTPAEDLPEPLEKAASQVGISWKSLNYQQNTRFLEICFNKCRIIFRHQRVIVSLKVGYLPVESNYSTEILNTQMRY